VVEQQAQELHKEFSTELQATQHGLEAKGQEFKVQLMAVEARTRHGGGRNPSGETTRVRQICVMDSVPLPVQVCC
jgi:hypothetical protein